jgi:hypothetical protein
MLHIVDLKKKDVWKFFSKERQERLLHILFVDVERFQIEVVETD